MLWKLHVQEAKVVQALFSQDSMSNINLIRAAAERL
jgi:hypothetical protein